MQKLLPLLGILFLFSCSSDSDKCEKKLDECEKKLDVLMANRNIPVDLPESKPVSTELFLTVKVTAEDKFLVDDKEYSNDELIELIDLKIENMGDSNKNMKIEGDKMAHYDAIFQLISIAKEKDLRPVLAYRK